MNKLRTWLTNPNVHLAIAGLCQIASFIPAAAPFVPTLQTIGATLTGTGLVLPESGSLHSTDYEKLAGVIADGVKQAVSQVQGRQ